MGRCYYEMDEYADAQDMADKACVNAQETSDVDMQFKASYLLAQCYGKQRLQVSSFSMRSPDFWQCFTNLLDLLNSRKRGSFS